MDARSRLGFYLLSLECEEPEDDDLPPLVSHEPVLLGRPEALITSAKSQSPSLSLSFVYKYIHTHAPKGTRLVLNVYTHPPANLPLSINVGRPQHEAFKARRNRSFANANMKSTNSGRENGARFQASTLQLAVPWLRNAKICKSGLGNRRQCKVGAAVNPTAAGRTVRTRLTRMIRLGHCSLSSLLLR